MPVIIWPSNPVAYEELADELVQRLVGHRGCLYIAHGSESRDDQLPPFQHSRSRPARESRRARDPDPGARRSGSRGRVRQTNIKRTGPQRAADAPDGAALPVGHRAHHTESARTTTRRRARIVRLITRRSRVRIPPPLLNKSLESRQKKSPGGPGLSSFLGRVERMSNGSGRTIDHRGAWAAASACIPEITRSGAPRAPFAKPRSIWSRAVTSHDKSEASALGTTSFVPNRLRRAELQRQVAGRCINLRQTTTPTRGSDARLGSFKRMEQVGIRAPTSGRVRGNAYRSSSRSTARSRSGRSRHAGAARARGFLLRPGEPGSRQSPP
jgi:hypothetical protein